MLFAYFSAASKMLKANQVKEVLTVYMNHIIFSGSHVLDNATSIRKLTRKEIFLTKKVNWWYFFKKYKEFQSLLLMLYPSKVTKVTFANCH